MALFKKLSDYSESELERVHFQLRDIFFLSSSVQSFENVERRERFYNRWLGHYLTHFSDFTWCAQSGPEGAVLAYLTVCPNTVDFLRVFDLESLKVFQKFYQDFPAHLHMNTHPTARGQGLGAKLIALAESELALREIPGLHLITGLGERNVAFYERVGFKVYSEQEFSGVCYLLMGKTITT